jgi:phosphogluconate dehydratase
MPELHKLTPALGVLQDRGYRVALATDGRMSGASGKVPAAIHVTPEAARGGLLGKVRDGDMITLDTWTGSLDVHVDPAELAGRPDNGSVPSPDEWTGTGRELFAAFRDAVGPADRGASLFTSRLPRQEHCIV